ncbi:N-alpha-acetyltransferase 60 isoform X1 [Pteronotus mesoamericanus]|uniref:N-alpha-acetyltransferase 60 isoform X1 n=1 Tax=Pteronotus mesoamericanus TaxID=1884717 RepID=UPI0023EB50D2|nr:N-alpha-acetyltransferase 60 isoform X1 [Pteronotus parnellii mesoamericanus]XP_054445471.1 N-alpha-acetyltransferase 60 isoform X1 [Pteronotus parnellii mesoamericanus]
MTEVVPSSALSEVSLRLLCHDDIDTVKHLCGDWFPIEYPDSWYRDITSNKKFFSLAATYRGTIVGMIVAEIKSRTKIHKEDGDILASNFSVDTQVAYILSLGVVKEFRKHGIGSLLLESLKDHISTTAQDHCKAIYLHVLTTNNTAINFYENRDFKQHHYLPYYYSIRGVLKDGFTYVLYINGGHPPWTILYPFLLGGFTARPTACSAASCHGRAFPPRAALSTAGPCDASRAASSRSHPSAPCRAHLPGHLTSAVLCRGAGPLPAPAAGPVLHGLRSRVSWGGRARSPTGSPSHSSCSGNLCPCPGLAPV